ncbi:MAG: type 1 glutamine amidotransferase domain-containing protein [Bacteroidota bacterium]
MSENILIVAADPAISTTTSWPVGFWLSEVTHPIKVFREAGYTHVIASPKGGKLEMDAMSNPHDESGRSAWDEISKTALEDKSFVKQLTNVPSLNDINPDDFDAIMVAGGQSPLFTFGEASLLQEMFTAFYNQGKVASALCHGTAILRYLKNENGKPFVDGKKVTGFSNGEEDDSDAFAGTKVMPWRIEDELIKLGAVYSSVENWKPYAIADRNLITGQQNMSGEVTAQMIVDYLSKHNS